MIFIKIIGILITAGAGLLQIGLEYKWHDKRTKKHKRVRSFLILLIIVGFLTALISVIYDDYQSGKQIDTLTVLKNGAEKNAKDAEKRELKAVKDRKLIKNELSELQEQIKPVVNLASEKYPSLDIKSALAQLAGDVQNLQEQNEKLQDQTKKLSVRDYFYPLDLSIKKIVSDRLFQIKGSLGNREIQISVKCQPGNTKRQRVTNELVSILSECGFDVSTPFPGITASITGVLPAVRITFNPSDEDIANKLAHALKPFLKVKYEGKINEKRKPGEVKIAIYGDPIFSEDGSVTFP